MKTLNINNYTFQYTVRGRGEPLIFVHGSASDYRTWEKQQETFSQHFRTIVYSRRYHWPNEPIPDGADYNMDEHVRDLEALLRALVAAPAHLVGHSYGAFVCMLLAIQAPELVRSLVLAEPPAITLFVSNSPKPTEILKLLFSRPHTAGAIIKFGAMGVAPATAAIRRGDMEEALSIFGKATLSEEAFENLSSSRLEQARANFIKAELLGSGFAPLDVMQLRTLQTPTLLISGETSPKLFHRLIDRLQELLPHTWRIEIPGAAHIMHEDNATVYNAEVLSFLTRQPQVVTSPMIVLNPNLTH